MARDPDDHLVVVPSVARARTALPQVSARDHRAEFQHPAPHRFVGHIEAALSQEILNIAVTQREAQIEPDRVLYDRWQEAMSSVGQLNQANLGDASSQTEEFRLRLRHLTLPVGLFNVS
jgi:hypothetical protein